LLIQPQNRPYFLGSVLLQEKGRGADADFKEYDVVDGQQRLTTLVVFMLCAIFRLEATTPAALNTRKRLFVADGDQQKFRTVSSDHDFFSGYIMAHADPPANGFETPSQRRLWRAKQYFTAKLAEIPDDGVERLIRTLETAQALVYVVATMADAAQIFELNNDRGKPLTDIECIKSFLMYLTLLNSLHPEDLLLNIQGLFQQIMRIVEQCREPGSQMDEDSILRYHCAAFEAWSDSEYNDPKHLLKNSVNDLGQEAIANRVQEFARNLREGFTIARRLMEMGETDGHVGRLFALGRRYQFFPLLMKACAYFDIDSHEFQGLARMLETFSFRAYGIVNVKADAGQRRLYRLARDFKGDLASLRDGLRDLSSWFDLDTRFAESLRARSFYSQGRDACYLLWMYENELQRERGFPGLSLSRFVPGEDPRLALEIEHVSPQGGADMNAEFERDWLHSLGNLVLSTRADNAQLGARPFHDKLARYDHSPFLSQQELRRLATPLGNGQVTWDAAAIERRRETLVQFALDHWAL
jgi:hypothetical protein